MLPLPAAVALVAGVIILGLAFRSIPHRVAQKLSLLCLLEVTFLIGWLPHGSIATGFFALLIWFLLPWLEILLRVRHLRLPAQTVIEPQRPPSRDAFPDLEALTTEIEQASFEHLDDAGWTWETQEQFFRSFYRPADHLQAAICSVEQDGVSFFFLSLTTRTPDGRLWTTWNYPFSQVLRRAPRHHIQRASATADFAGLLQEHMGFSPAIKSIP